MEALFGRVVFTSGDRKYDWVDVVLAARLWGDWASLEEEVRQGIACRKRMEEAEDFPDSEEVESAAREFRYARDLLTAQETEAWLERWNLTVEGWMDYLQRALLRQKWSDQLTEIVACYPVTEGEIENCLQYESVCSGYLAHWAQKLAARAAADEKLRVTAAPETGDEEAEEDPRAVSATSLPDMEERGLPGVSLEACQEKVIALTRLEAVFQHFCQQLRTSQSTEDQISSHQLDWIRLDCCSAIFPEELIAREAVLCVREDGRELSEVAAEAKAVARQVRFYLDELEPAWRAYFLSAQKGELVGPLSMGEEFALFVVLDKIWPSVADPEIRQRAEQRALLNAVEHEVNDRVQWQIRL